MFVRNSTSLDVALARGSISDDASGAALVVSHVLGVGDGGLTPLAKPLPSGEHDPPSGIMRLVLWDGVSVTATGTAVGPVAAPFVCPVLFRIGTVERRLIVFGERRWEQRFGGGLEASPPAPFEQIELSFARAFGGGYDLPPGLLPGTDLPHPGVRVAYQLNPRGVGYYPDERAAAGSPLPNIERPDQLVRRWSDAPEPAGFTPCRDLVAWRLKDEAAAIAQGQSSSQGPASAPRFLMPSLRIQHHAPPWLIFPDLAAGTPIELHGLRGSPLRFAVPTAPARGHDDARAQGRKTPRSGRCSARCTSTPTQRAVHLVYDHRFLYDPRRPPSWIRVSPTPQEGTS